MGDKHWKIGLFINQLDRSYQSMIWRTVSLELRKAGHQCIVFPGKTLLTDAENDVQYNSLFNLAGAAGLDGLIVVSGVLTANVSLEEFQNFLSQFKPLPIVSFNTLLPDYPSILVNNRTGIFQAVNHLVRRHGCKRIFYIGGPKDHWESEERLAGFREGMEKNCLELNPDWIYYGTLEADSGRLAAEKILSIDSDKPDGVIAANDDMILGALNEFYRHNIRIPEDLAVTGFDNTKEAQSALPPLTTVRQPLESQIAKSVEVLLDLIAGKDVDRQLYLDSSLVIRQSCGCLNFQEDGLSVDTLLARDIPSLLTSLDEDVRSRMEGRLFLAEMNRLLLKSLKEGKDISGWEGCLDFLNQEIRQRNYGPGSHDQALLILEKARVLFLDTLNRGEIKQSLELENQQLALSRISQSLITTQDIKTLLTRMYDYLPQLGILHFALVLYNGEVQWDGHLKWMLPEEGRVIAELSAGKIRKKEKQIHLKKWLPRFFSEADSLDSYIILPVFFQNEHYAFLVVQGGIPTDILYDTLRGQISSALKGISLIKKEADTAAELREAVKKLEESKEKIEQMSIEDELTGLYNRRGFLTLCRQELELAKRKNRDFVLIFIDLDGLKTINDTYGHKEGDAAIVQTARILNESFRSTDIVARLGGDEFTVLAIDTTIKDLEIFKERIGMAVDEFNKKNENPFQLSMSLGASPFNPKKILTIEEMMEEADAQLYQEKIKKKSSRRSH